MHDMSGSKSHVQVEVVNARKAVRYLEDNSPYRYYRTYPEIL